MHACMSYDHLLPYNTFLLLHAPHSALTQQPSPECACSDAQYTSQSIHRMHTIALHATCFTAAACTCKGHPDRPFQAGSQHTTPHSHPAALTLLSLLCSQHKTHDDTLLACLLSCP